MSENLKSIEVEATVDDVKKLLAAELTADEYKSLNIIETQPEFDPFSPTPKRDAALALALVQFTANAVIGGILYDLTKKVYGILKQKYGGKAVTEVDQVEGTDGKDN